jgi:tetratricopeptide (TPR) repeat protein
VISQLLFAHSTLGVALHYSGEVEKALEHQEQAIALCDSIERQSLEFVYGLDPGVTSECLSSFGLLQLGYPDRALDRAERAIEHARAHHYAYGLAYALNWGGIVHHERGEPGRVLERATEAFEISTERGLSQQLGGAAIYRACALSHLSDEEAAGKTVDAVAKSIRGSRPTAPVSGPFLAAFADAQRRLQRMDDALGTVDSWLSYSNEIGAPYWDAEHLRLKGEILLANDPASHDEPERLFRHAIYIA